jgi:hypothetical protein
MKTYANKLALGQNQGKHHKLTLIINDGKVAALDYNAIGNSYLYSMQKH